MPGGFSVGVDVAKILPAQIVEIGDEFGGWLMIHRHRTLTYEDTTEQFNASLQRTLVASLGDK